MKFDLKTDWSKWEVVEGDDVYRFVALDTPEVGCECCGGYASWQVQNMSDPFGYIILECSNCLLADATDPSVPGTYHYYP